MKLKLRAGRELTGFGGYGVLKMLHDTHNTPAVFWSPNFNSYVAIQNEDGSYRVLSINGIGEIRWELNPLGYMFEGSQGGDSSAGVVFDYFFEGR